MKILIAFTVTIALAVPAMFGWAYHRYVGGRWAGHGALVAVTAAAVVSAGTLLYLLADWATSLSR